MATRIDGYALEHAKTPFSLSTLAMTTGGPFDAIDVDDASNGTRQV